MRMGPSQETWGEVDSRFSYVTVCCLSLLHRLDSINVEKAVEYIVSCKNMDGGFGCTSGGESHAGQDTEDGGISDRPGDAFDYSTRILEWQDSLFLNIPEIFFSKTIVRIFFGRRSSLKISWVWFIPYCYKNPPVEGSSMSN